MKGEGQNAKQKKERVNVWIKMWLKSKLEKVKQVKINSKLRDFIFQKFKFLNVFLFLIVIVT